jgi:hypothetical protein
MGWCEHATTHLRMEDAQALRRQDRPVNAVELVVDTPTVGQWLMPAYSVAASSAWDVLHSVLHRALRGTGLVVHHLFNSRGSPPVP